jgi:hypothetical protein
MKRWYLTGPFPGVAYRLTRESHFICLQTPAEMASGAKSSSGLHFGGIEFPGAAEMQAFEALPGMTPLGHVHTPNNLVPQNVVVALAAYGVVQGDTLHAAVTKVIAKTGNWPMGLREL